jgi:hypothetical protein
MNNSLRDAAVVLPLYATQGRPATSVTNSGTRQHSTPRPIAVLVAVNTSRASCSLLLVCGGWGFFRAGVWKTFPLFLHLLMAAQKRGRGQHAHPVLTLRITPRRLSAVSWIAMNAPADSETNCASFVVSMAVLFFFFFESADGDEGVVFVKKRETIQWGWKEAGTSFVCVA